MGDRLQWILDQRGISARRLSEDAGMSQSYVGQIIRGTIGEGIAFDRAEALARAGGVGVHWLLTGQGEPTDQGAALPVVVAEPGRGDLEGVAGRVKSLRISRRMTQKAVANAIGADSITVSRWERGSSSPSDENLKQLAELFGVTPAWLEYGVEQESHIRAKDGEPENVVDRAIYFVFGGEEPPAELRERIHRRADLVGFSDGGSLGLLADLVERERSTWLAEQKGLPPKVAEPEATKVEPREGAMRRKVRK